MSSYLKQKSNQQKSLRKDDLAKRVISVSDFKIDENLSLKMETSNSLTVFRFLIYFSHSPR